MRFDGLLVVGNHTVLPPTPETASCLTMTRSARWLRSTLRPSTEKALTARFEGDDPARSTHDRIQHECADVRADVDDDTAVGDGTVILAHEDDHQRCEVRSAGGGLDLKP